MLEDTLADLERRRLGFKARQAQIDEELKERRRALLAEEVTTIEDTVARAIAEGATLGQIKKAYGTKDHRTVSEIVARRQAEIKYWQDTLANMAAARKSDWFVIDDDCVRIGEIRFDYQTMEDGKILLLTDVPQWNDDYTIENETVRDFDGKTEDESDRVREIAEAIREQR